MRASFWVYTQEKGAQNRLTKQVSRLEKNGQAKKGDFIT